MTPNQLLSLIIYYGLFFLAIIAAVFFVMELPGVSFVFYFMAFLIAMLVYVNRNEWFSVKRNRRRRHKPNYKG